MRAAARRAAAALPLPCMAAPCHRRRRDCRRPWWTTSRLPTPLLSPPGCSVAQAYWTDKNCDSISLSKKYTSISGTGNLSKADAARAIKAAGLTGDASPEEIAKALKEEMEPPKTRAYYRRKGLEGAVGTTGTAGGKKKVHPTPGEDIEMEGGAKKDDDDAGYKARTTLEVDASSPGMIRWERSLVKIPESGGSVKLVVHREGGSKGAVSVAYATKDQQAKAGKDFEKVEGEFSWADGDTEPKTVEIKIFDDDEYEKDEHFTVVLSDAKGGCTFDKTTDGGVDAEVCTVIILNDDDKAQKLSSAIKLLKLDSDSLDIAGDDYIQAVKDTFSVPDGGAKDKIMWLLTLPWKIMFNVLVPPAGLCNGWPCFFFALLMIGCQVVLISDFASQMDCQMYLPDTVTAITFVALGTSLPDTFASMQAARQDKYADNSIGNVTGSNAVNVFLGLGLPWLLGSAYWAIVGANDSFDAKFGRNGEKPWPPAFKADSSIPGPAGLAGKYADSGAFYVSRSGLGLSVLVFVGCATMTLSVILCRRFYLNPPAELGGKKSTAKMHAAFLVFLWFIYITVSCLNDPLWGVIKYEM